MESHKTILASPDTFKSRKNSQLYTAQQIATILAKRISDGKVKTPSEATGLLYEQFGFAEDYLDAIVWGAAHIVRSAPIGDQKPPEACQSIRSIADALDADVFARDALKQHEALFQSRISEADLTYLNDKLEKCGVRKMTYLDLAIIFSAFKHNVLSNEDGGCPQSSIIAFTEDLEEVPAPFSTLHVKAAIEVFIALKLTEMVAKHNHFKHRGARYKML